MTISRNGSVKHADVSGTLSGTPTGLCVQDAVKAATFPAFDGPPMAINYPFMLR